MTEWQRRKLGDLCTRITVGHVGSMASRYTESGIPFLRSLNIKRGGLDLSSLKFIDDAFHAELAKSQLKFGDLVIVRTGDPGTAALIPDDLGPMNCSDLVIVTPGPEVDARFLCYAINETAQDFVKAHTVGAVQQHFNVKSAKQLEISLPPISVQLKVSELLGALDDMIAINERIAARVDTLIGYLFRAALYQPDPRQLPLLEALQVTFGSPFASSDFSTEGLGRPLLRIRDLKTYEPQIWTTQSLEKELVVDSGDVVAGMDAEFRPTFWLGKPALLNQRVMHVQPRVGGGRALAREALREPLAAVESYKTGTTVAHLNKSDLSMLSVQVPSERATTVFGSKAEPLRQRLVATAAESRALAALRDTLLPQLMSGRLRVKDAEKIVEDAT
ncbi:MULTISPECIES: restriction endonuclease subunit S [unclassified Streptomyces]|uniref:restriction endonuclease subunit S n=1 Tax=unclassified Streptomyces TaxID=2593676 RepID=UPI0036ED0667